jgi:hypothetical protein
VESFGGGVAGNAFILQKRTIRVITNLSSRESRRHLFEKLELITFCSQFMYSLILFTIKSNHLFSFINEIHKHKTRSLNNLYLPAVNLTKCSKGAYVVDINAFNHLPQALKVLATGVLNFKTALKRFLLHYSFHSMKEYYQPKQSQYANHNITHLINFCNILLVYKFAVVLFKLIRASIGLILLKNLEFVIFLIP